MREESAREEVVPWVGGSRELAAALVARIRLGRDTHGSGLQGGGVPGGAIHGEVAVRVDVVGSRELAVALATHKIPVPVWVVHEIAVLLQVVGSRELAIARKRLVRDMDGSIMAAEDSPSL